MNLLFVTCLFLYLPYGITDTKMKISILPPEDDSSKSSKQLLRNFKELINNDVYLKDSIQLQKIKTDSIKTYTEQIPITKVILPIKCKQDLCDKSIIRRELSDFLEIDPSRLRIRVIHN